MGKGASSSRRRRESLSWSSIVRSVLPQVPYPPVYNEKNERQIALNQDPPMRNMVSALTEQLRRVQQLEHPDHVNSLKTQEERDRNDGLLKIACREVSTTCELRLDTEDDIEAFLKFTHTHPWIVRVIHAPAETYDAARRRLSEDGLIVIENRRETSSQTEQKRSQTKKKMLGKRKRGATIKFGWL